MTAALERMRILVVEDEFLVASLIEDMLKAAGCTISGPVARLAEALDAVAHETFDAAILDVNLGGDRIDPVADALSKRKVPFMFVTGYGTTALPGEYRGRPHLCKPFKMDDLLGALTGLVEHPANRGWSR
jgi:DNA-binding response OmpR family regulator